jgi:hypothetical protein
MPDAAGQVPKWPSACTCATASPTACSLIDRLAELYSRQLVQVTTLIHSKLDRKAQQFANAFTWRKDS